MIKTSKTQSRIARNIKPRDIGLKSDSFSTDLPDEITPRVIGNVEAHQKVGKTDFCIRHAPDPIVIFNFDQGLEGVVEKHRAKGKIIIVAGKPPKKKIQGKVTYPSYAFARPIPLPGQGRKSEEYLGRVKKAAYPLWELWISDTQEFYESEARTGIVDTGGGAFALGKFAYLGMDKYKPGDDDPYGQKSGNLKSLFQGIVTNAYSYDKNMLWTHRLKETFGSPGNFEIDGYKQLPYEVQITLRLSKLVRRGSTVRKCEIRESRIGAHLNGEIYSSEDKMFRFDKVMAEVFGNDISDWQ